MIKTIVRLFLFNIPFLLIGGVFWYLGWTAGEHELTDDGFPLKTFYYLMGSAFPAITLGVSFLILLWLLIKRKRINEIIATGKQGTAVVLQLSDTGVTINNAPRVRLLLEIHIPNYQPYRAQKTVTIPLIFLPQVQTGSTVKILAVPEEPANENKIALLLK